MNVFDVLEAYARDLITREEARTLVINIAERDGLGFYEAPSDGDAA